MRDADRRTVHLSGEYDLMRADELQAALTESADVAEVVADFSDVSFLDSAGIRALVNAHDWLAERSVVLVVAGASPFVRRVLEVTALDTLIDVRE